jgi:multiple sugar transport system ATP-binding protein
VAQVRLDAVSKVFGDVVAVDDVTIAVGDHDFMILLGPSGCGKSTLLRMIAGLEDPTRGDVYIGDLRVNDIEPKQRDVAMVFQSYALYPHKTVQANIEFPLKARGVPKPERAQQAVEAAGLLGLHEQLGRRPGQLSGGQRQRVALARAIVRHPAVFCMDEPLSNLDAKLRSDTRSELVALHRRLSSTFVYVTHDQVEAMTMGTHVAVMNRGRIEQIGVPAEVYARPESVFVAQFIGTPPMNIFPAGMVEPGDHLLGVRPEHVHLDASSDLRMTVGLVELLGHETLVHGRLGETPVVARVSSEVAPPLVGDEAGLGLPAAHRHRFDAVTGRRVTERS